MKWLREGASPTTRRRLRRPRVSRGPGSFRRSWSCGIRGLLGGRCGRGRPGFGGLVVGNGLRELDGTDLVIYVNDGIVTRARHRAPFAGVGASTWCWSDEAAAIKLKFKFWGSAFQTVDGASRGFVKVGSLGQLSGLYERGNSWRCTSNPKSLTYAATSSSLKVTWSHDKTLNIRHVTFKMQCLGLALRLIHRFIAGSLMLWSECTARPFPVNPHQAFSEQRHRCRKPKTPETMR